MLFRLVVFAFASLISAGVWASPACDDACASGDNCPQSAHSETDQNAPDKDCVATGHWELGVALGIGYAGNPLIDGDDLLTPLLPRWSYYGEHFFVETTTLGWTLSESPRYRVNLLSWANQDYVFFSKSGNFTAALTPPYYIPAPADGNYHQPGLGVRRLTYLAGVEASWFSGNWQWQWRAGQDISVGHKGIEASVDVKWHWQKNDHTLSTDLGLLYRDANLSNYYYGSDESETANFRWQYYPGATLSPRLNIAYTHRLSDDMNFIFSIAAQKIDKKIADSLLVQNDVWTAGFMGVSYDF